LAPAPDTARAVSGPGPVCTGTEPRLQAEATGTAGNPGALADRRCTVKAAVSSTGFSP